MTTNRTRLLPGALLSLPVFGFTLLWGIVVQLGEWAALGESVGALAMRMAMLGAVQLLMFAFPFVTLLVICPRVSATIWNRLLLVSVFVGATARGAALGILMFLTGISDAPDLAYRIMASVTHIGVVTVLLWFLVSEVRSLRARQHQLVSERDRLLALQHDAERNSERLSDRVTAEIRLSIMESLGGLQADDPVELRERLRVTIDDVVRPLSHHLATQPTTSMPVARPEAIHVDWSQAVREGLDPVRIHPVLVPLVLVWLGLPIHLFLLGPSFTRSLLVTVFIAIPAFWLLRRAAIWLSAGHSDGAKAVAFACAVALGGMALGLATLPYMQDQPQPLLFAVAGPLLSLLVSSPLAIAEAAREQNLALESDLQATTEDLRWTLARARERHRQHEGALAHALHGRLQASLAAAYLRLDQAMAHGCDDADLLNALQTEVREAVCAVDVIDSTPEAIDKLMALTQSNWAGAAHVGFATTPEARVAQAQDAICARSVNDLIPELVFNSVRHGNARVIEVRLEVVDSRTLSLTVTDDGRGELDTAHRGLGSSLLDQASINWTRTREGGHTTTTCLVPYATPASTTSILVSGDSDSEEEPTSRRHSRIQ